MAKAKQPPVTRQKVKSALVAPTGKENQPPQKTKKTVNINAMYDAPQSHKRKRDEDDGEEARVPLLSNRRHRVADPSFFTKRAREQEQQLEPQKGFFKQFAKKPSFGFGAAEASFEERWAAWQKQLKNREAGVDEVGDDLEAPVPTDTDIDALRQQIADLGKPLEDDLMRVRTSEGIKDIRLSHTLSTWGESSKKTREQVVKIEKKLSKIDKQMNILEKELKNENTAKVDVELSRELKALEAEVEKIEQQAEAERQKMKKDQQKAKKEFDRKLKELMETTLGGA